MQCSKANGFFQIVLKKVKNLDPSPSAQNDRAPKPIKTAFTSNFRVGRSRCSRHFSLKGLPLVAQHFVLSRPFAVLSALLRTLRPQSAVRGAHGTSSDITSSVGRSRSSRHFFGHYVLSRCATLVLVWISEVFKGNETSP